MAKPDGGPLLELEHLMAGYGQYMAVHDVSLTVGRGELVALLGPNGAGKTTLLKAIIGLLKPKNGRIRFEGNDITGTSPGGAGKLGIGYVPQGLGVFPQMTVQENLEAGAYMMNDRGLMNRRVEEALALFPRLRERYGNRALSLSGGERQMLLMARALMMNPKLLLLDEPSLGLDPKSQQTLYGTIGEMHSKGKSILLVEQNISWAMKIADRLYVQEVGRTVYEGNPADAASTNRVKNAYLGL